MIILVEYLEKYPAYCQHSIHFSCFNSSRSKYYSLRKLIIIIIIALIEGLVFQKMNCLLYILPHLILSTVLWSRYYYRYHHFTNGKTVIQKENNSFKVNFLINTESEFKPGHLVSDSIFFYNYTLWLCWFFLLRQIIIRTLENSIKSPRKFKCN